MKKLLIACSAMAVLSASVAMAEPTAEIFTAAGCDAEFLRPVLAGDGETVLYWQNTDGKGCDASKRGGLRDDLANIPGLAVDPDEEDPEDEEVASVW